MCCGIDLVLCHTVYVILLLLLYVIFFMHICMSATRGSPLNIKLYPLTVCCDRLVEKNCCLVVVVSMSTRVSGDDTT